MVARVGEAFTEQYTKNLTQIQMKKVTESMREIVGTYESDKLFNQETEVNSGSVQATPAEE